MNLPTVWLGKVEKLKMSKGTTLRAKSSGRAVKGLSFWVLSIGICLPACLPSLREVNRQAGDLELE